jgi:hypothetical protein
MVNVWTSDRGHLDLSEIYGVLRARALGLVSGPIERLYKIM